MQILFVTPFLPSPPRFGGQRRLDGLMRALSKRHEVSVLAFNREDPFAEMSLEASRTYCKEVVVFPEPDLEGTREKRLFQARSLASLHSFEYLNFARRREFQERLDQMLSRGAYDVVQFEFAQMAVYRFARTPGKARAFVLDEHNVEYDVLRRTAEGSTSPVRRIYNALNWRKLAREERKAWGRFDGVVFTSDRDEALVKAESSELRTAVIPNGADVEAFRPLRGREEPDTLLFFGAISYFPNQDGVVSFIDDILPKIRAKRPNVKLHVLGPGARDEVLARQGNGVEILGMVDDVGPYIDRAAAVVVPLRIGGGTRLKIMEALAKGKALISTRLGAEGIDVVDDEHVLLADEPADFAAAVDRVLGDRMLATRLGDAGRRLIEERYGWQGIAGNLERFYQTLL
jgi:glycosyltransferase involved in cell wall biosynthesis